jgi:hypothetical protein
MDFSTSVAVGDMFLGTQVGTTNYVFATTSTNINIVIDGTTTSYTVADLSDGKLHTLKIVRVSGSVELFIDDVSSGVQSNSGTFIIENIGRYGNNRHWDGVISEVKITDGTDLIRYYKIDEDLSATATIIDYGSDGSNGTAVSITSSELFTLEGADWIGAELVTNGNFATDTDWTKGTGVTISGGKAHFATSTGAGLYLPNPIDTFLSGLTYKISLEVSSYVSGTANLEIMNQAEDDFVITSNNGTKTGIKTVQTASVYRPLFRTTSWIADIDNVSVKRILQAP